MKTYFCKTLLISLAFSNLLFPGTTTSCQAQSPVTDDCFAWAKTVTGENAAEGYAITTDAANNVYTLGIYEGTADFDPGPGTYNLTANGEYDIFVSKLDMAGNLVWAKSFGGTIQDEPRSIAVDAFGNVYTTGFFWGTVDFNPGPGVFNLNATGATDIFISKLDAAGNFVWAKKLGGNSYDYGNAITTDATGNVYISGSFETTVDFDPGPGTFYLYSLGYGDAFVLKLSATGTFQWVKSYGGGGVDYGNALAVDAAGNVHITGFFQEGVDFDPGSNEYNLYSYGSSDMYVSKLDAAGNFLWAKQMGGSEADNSFGIAVDNTGNVYLSGLYVYTAQFGPFTLTPSGSYDISISKLDAAGNFLWVKSIGGAENESVANIALDASGNIYTTGQFWGTADFDPDPAVTANLTSNGDADDFILKLDTDGHYIWAKQIGGGTLDGALSIAVDGLGCVCTTGYFIDVVDFDPGPNIYQITGQSDAFMLKLCTCGFSKDTEAPVDGFSLGQNSPNPFDQTTDIRYSLPTANHITLEVYNILGNKVEVLVDEYQSAGAHTIRFDSRDLPPGNYLYVIQSGNLKQVRKMVISPD